MRYDFLVDIGQVRQNNEDVAWVGINKNENFAGIVCDGLGGYKGGSTASSIVVDVFKERFSDINLNFFSREEIFDWIEKTISVARDRISNKIKENSQLKNMATTFVACIVVNSKAYIFNIGDSRAWFISKDKVEQITEDQNLYNFLIKNKVGKEMFELYRDNLYAITQFVGAQTNKKLNIDVYEIDVQDGAYIALTSDGTHNFIGIDEIRHCLIGSKINFNDVCTTIIAKAMANGSNDNLSIVIMEF